MQKSLKKTAFQAVVESESPDLKTGTHDRRGLFITFEGPEGAGKSTQVTWLAEYLASRGIPFCRTREPGGTPLAEELRAILKHRNGGEVFFDQTELLLIAAARVQHVGNVIRPALERGEVVLCDRFADSTEAYQQGGRRLDPDLIAALRKVAVNGDEPDLTFILDLTPEAGFERTRGRAETAGQFDRFEAEDLDFHRRVREAFLAIARREPERVRVLDATRTPDVIQAEVRRWVDAAL